MGNFRLVILDYAKPQLDNPLVKNILSDLIPVKQQNFERTDENYIVLDKHDLIGTHVLIYDVINLYEPRLIFALRLTYDNRGKKHKIQTPVQQILNSFSSECQLALNSFLAKNKVLIECNSLFVDPEFSRKNSNYRLSDWAFAAACQYLESLGYNHLAACPNMKYKASRMIENIGNWVGDFDFVHPTVTDPHKLVLIENFNHIFIKEVIDSNKDLFQNMLVLKADPNIAELDRTTSKKAS